VVVRAPFERDGRTERVTLASRAVLDRRETRETVDDAKDAISDGPDRQRRIEELSRIATAYPDADDLREAAEGRGPTVPDDVPRRSVVAGDLRALDLLTAESGARIAAPEFDPSTPRPAATATRGSATRRRRRWPCSARATSSA